MDDEIEMQHAPRPSLDSGNANPSDRRTEPPAPAALASRHQPLDLHEPQTTKPKVTRRLTPLRFCLGCVALAGLVGLALLGWGLVWLVRLVYEGLARPHAIVHGNATLIAAGLSAETELVRPYFGPTDSGALEETFDLGALVYARWDERLAPAEEDELPGKAPALDLSWLDSLMGIKPTPPERADWTLIYREIVLKSVSVSTKPVRTTVQVKIPKDVVMSLVDATLHPEMFASFVVLPPSKEGSDPLAKGRTTHFATVRSTSRQYPMNNGLPPPWIPYRDDSEAWSPFTDFFAYPAAQSVLLHKRGLADATDPASTIFDVATRSWVTMARDFPVYNITQFHNQMAVLRQVERGECGGGRIPSSLKPAGCRQQFSHQGHFENLLELEPRPQDGEYEPEMPNDDTSYWYAPYLTAELGSAAGPKDYVPLPTRSESVDSDFSFNWRITFSTSSPFKLGAVEGIDLETDASWRLDASAIDLAASQDNAEIWNALIHHPFEPGTRPVVRGAMRLLESLLGMALPLVSLDFWLTRSLSTGISMPLVLAEAVLVLLIGGLVDVRELAEERVGFVLIALQVGWDLFMLWLKASLALRLKMAWGGPRGWIPVGVSRRRPTHSERASARDIATLSGLLQTIVFALFLAAGIFGSSLPHLISGSQVFLEMAADAKDPAETAASSSRVASALYPVQDAVWHTLLVSQLSLNFRRRSFGGGMRAEGFGLGLLALLQVLPTVAQSYLGRPVFMEPLQLVNLVDLVLQGSLAYQALALPPVPQEEPEDA